MKSRYAVRALTELARREETAPGKPVRLGDIAGSRDMPLQFLEQVFSALRRGGVVRSRRGAAGGYSLARPAAVDGCGAASVWIEAQQALAKVLGGTTIGDLLAREDALRGRAPMYQI